MPARILIDTFNSALARPTGIGTYARVLAKAGHRLGHEVLLLTEAPIAHSPRAERERNDAAKTLSVADPVLLFDHFREKRRGDGGGPPDVPWYVRNRFFSLRRLMRRWPIATPPLHLVPQLDRVDQTAIRHRLGHFDAIVNGADLFGRALQRFRQSRQPTIVDLPLDVDIAHFTWCLPIRARNARTNIYTLHDLIPLRFPHLTLEEKSVYYDLVHWCCRAADMIVTVSEHTRHEIIELIGVPPEKVVNTSQSIDPGAETAPWPVDELKSSLRSLFGLNHGEYFLLAGALEPRKNVARAIEAHLSAATGFPLVLCGPRTPQSEAELRLLDNPQLRERWAAQGQDVIVLDYLPRHLVALLMAGARAVLVPSITEGFGLSALEAMSLGTPVIAARSGALPEVCGSAATYVDPYKIVDLRNAIQRAATWSAADMAELRSRSIAQAKCFSFESYCARLGALHSRLLAAPGDAMAGSR